MDYYYLYGLLAIYFGPLCALNNGLALTPPMGWLSWQRYRCTTDCKMYPDQCLNSNLLLTQAEQMVKLGLKDLGYQYIIIDDCWLNLERNKSNGELLPDPARFPLGMKFIGDMLHKMGLKFGIYEDMGTETCEGYPGSLFKMETDAKTLASWGVDYVKLDGCNVDVDLMKKGYPEMGKALNLTNRPIVYSCSWPAYLRFSGKPINFTMIKDVCNLWRYYGDVDDDWSTVKDIISYTIQHQDNITSFAGPGHWNDPDMLVVGNYGLSHSQEKLQFGLWAVLAAPLILSVDLSTIRQESLSIISNKEIIAINQDPLGIQGKMIFNDGPWYIYSKKLMKSEFAVAIVNLATYQGIIALYTLKLTRIDPSLNDSVAMDLYEGSEVKSINGTITVKSTQNGIVLLKLIPSKH